MSIDRDTWRDGETGRDDDGWSRLGRPGGDWHGLRPTFDNPLSWSLPLGAWAGIRVRLHVVFLLFIVIMLLRSLAPVEGDVAPAAFPVVALLLGALLLTVLAHEVGHCLACRRVGGTADEILLWPLGGLSFCRPGHASRSHLVTAAGGPAVNLLICIVAGTALGLATGRWVGTALPNPLRFDGMAMASSIGGRLNWPLLALFAVHWTSLVLLLFNLLPVFPLDGGRLVQAILWPRLGYGPAMRMAVRVGYIGAIGLGIVGAVLGQWLLVAVALFGGITCWITRKQLDYTDAELGLEPWAEPEPEPEPVAPPQPSRRERHEAEESQEVDRILAKIADSGMDSLDRGERRLLQRVTARRKAEDGNPGGGKS